MPKYNLWERSRELQDGITLTLRRTRNVPKSGKDSYRTELVCCGKVLPVAHMSNEANADWLLGTWIKTIRPMLWKYSAQTNLNLSIDSPETFAQAIVMSEQFLAATKEEERKLRR